MSNRTFSDYVADRRTGYKYTIKFALPEVNDAMLDLLETCLSKYNLVSATKFRSTPIQLAPLEFPNIKSTPVHSSDIELEYPASLDFLKTYIANSLDISQGQIAVYSEHDPRQTELDLFLSRTSPDFKDSYTPALGSEYQETGDQSLYGEAYNMEFLKALAQVRSERETVIATSPFNPEKMPSCEMGDDYHSYLDKKNTPKNDTGLFGRIKVSKQLMNKG